MRNYYSGDPYWMRAKYPGTCSNEHCKQPFNKGDRVFRFKNGSMFPEKCGCGIGESESFRQAAEDEYMVTGPQDYEGRDY